MIKCRMNVSKYNGRYMVYGLDFFEADVFIKRVPDITVSFALIRKMMREINSANLSANHIDDVIDDFLP